MADYNIGSNLLPGLSKIIEESGELQQVIGKLIGSNGNFDHWSGNLKNNLYDEIADLDAALEFFIWANDLDWAKIQKRKASKLEQFKVWHLGEENA